MKIDPFDMLKAFTVQLISIVASLNKAPEHFGPTITVHRISNCTMVNCRYQWNVYFSIKKNIIVINSTVVSKTQISCIRVYKCLTHYIYSILIKFLYNFTTVL